MKNTNHSTGRLPFQHSHPSQPVTACHSHETMRPKAGNTVIGRSTLEWQAHLARLHSPETSATPAWIGATNKACLKAPSWALDSDGHGRSKAHPLTTHMVLANPQMTGCFARRPEECVSPLRLPAPAQLHATSFPSGFTRSVTEDRQVGAEGRPHCTCLLVLQ